jgi:hypothetical protein
MLRFFRTRAPLVGWLLLVALPITLPGIRHPLPLAGLAVFTALAWRALSRWRARQPEPVAALSLDDLVARSAAAWDARHGGVTMDEVEEDDGDTVEPEDEPAGEPWRASLKEWRGE